MITSSYTCTHNEQEYVSHNKHTNNKQVYISALQLSEDDSGLWSECLLKFSLLFRNPRERGEWWGGGGEREREGEEDGERERGEDVEEN